MTRVLYIDDGPTLLTLTQIYLKEEANLDVEVANPAKKGAIRLRYAYFDAIISDYDMPDVGGIELLKCIRAEKPSIPFVIFIGKDREEIVIETLNYGADFHLQKGGDPKPFFTELTNAVKHLVRRNQAENSAIQNEKYWTPTRDAMNKNVSRIKESTQALLGHHPDLPDTHDLIRNILTGVMNIQTKIEQNPKKQENYKI